MIRILVTAFGAFPGAPVNPTMSIVAYLAKRASTLRRAGIEIRTAVLPVRFAGTRERLAELLADIRPDAVLHLGLAGRRKTISVETRALNRLTILHPDAGRRLSGSLLVENKGPQQRRSRFAADRLVRTISRSGVPARISIDAGDYLCNQVLYLTLGLHKGLCGFIHVPKPRRLRAPGGVSASRPRPLLTEMASAIEQAVRQIATDSRTNKA